MGAARGVTPAGPDKVLRVEVPKGGLRAAWLQGTWLSFARPLLGLRGREGDAAEYLLARGGAALAPGDRAAMCRSMGVTRGHLRKILAGLRRKGFLEGDRVSRRYVPEGRGDGHFRLMIDFVEHD